MRKRTLRVTGQVQGVGFRPFVYRVAHELGLAGSVWNDQRGVTIEAWGPAPRLDELERRLAAEAPALARVADVRRLGEAAGDDAPDGFVIRASDVAATERGRVTTDSAVCADCLREMRDPDDRRFRHALINCTNCGPRFTIVRDLPYDRSRTTMASFPMCPPCAAEYGDPADRRFHAQPTCCPACGPRLRLLDAGGTEAAGDPVAAAATRLRAGGLLAVKGLGGYHLAADARAEPAVVRLRRGKRRDHKPFAIMVASLAHARRLVRLSDEAARLLESPVCPIVLAPRRDDDDLAPSVAPGCHRLGVMLPYTPLQHLLIDEPCLRDAVLVMTSANFSDDPLITEDADAVGRLAGICDAFLVHDRPIERAVDDSIVLDASFGAVPFRRARGSVPEPLPLPVAAPRPGLCAGSDLKNTVAIARGDEVITSQHIGDLGWSLAYRRFERTIEDLQRLYDVEPAWVACDLHPGYVSHAFARRAARARGVDLVVVQHHHAHLASLLAEHGRADPIVGLVCDGVGYGDDGSAWGGEVLVGDLAGYRRVARLRPLRLPGGDAAAKRTGRCGLSWLADALGPDAARHPRAAAMLPDDEERDLVRRLLADGPRRCPPSSGAGRLFDAAASLLGVCDFNHYEAMSGTVLEAAARAAGERPAGDGVMRLAASDAEPDLVELDHRPLLSALLARLEGGPSPADVGPAAWLFHDALADGLARAARDAAVRHGLATVGLSGGVFCNELLTERVAGRLRDAGLEVLVHRALPPNDGGLACGQAAVAAATLAGAGR
ncbi:MAG: carbamoyltransferase HypF [Planctomycetota bacterium]|jgi:hydrogenase maturation protein HypF